MILYQCEEGFIMFAEINRAIQSHLHQVDIGAICHWVSHLYAVNDKELLHELLRSAYQYKEVADKLKLQTQSA